MGSNFSVGIELLVIGLSVVFTVLLLLMFIMQLMGYLINRPEKTGGQTQNMMASPRTDLVSSGNTTDEELAAVVSVMSAILPKRETLVRLNITEVKN